MEAEKYRRNQEKKDYLAVYRQTMSYDEYIRYNKINDNMRVCYENSVYIFGTFFVTGYLYYTIRSPVIKLHWKQITKNLSVSGILTFAYYKYHKIPYSSELNDLFINVSSRIQNNPNLKLRPNSDYFDGCRADEFDD